MILFLLHRQVAEVYVFFRAEVFEGQRYGRNRDTLINKTYINSGNYRRKFDLISDDIKLKRLLYLLAKKMLTHRAGTLFEDMYWIDPETRRKQ